MVGYDESQSHHLSEFWHATDGIISGCLTRFLIQPLDVLKIRFQLQHEPLSRKYGNSYYTNILQAFRRILSEESKTAIFKGHLTAQYLSGVYGLVQFAAFEFLTKSVAMNSTIIYDEKSKTKIHFLCGSLSGMAATFASMPFDTVRTRLVSQGEPKVYNGLINAFSQMIKQEGFFSLYKGLWPNLIQIAPYAGIQFGTFQFLKNNYSAIVSSSPHDAEGKLSISANLICGSLSGITAKIAVYPLDLTKKRLQVQGFEMARVQFGKVSKYTGFLHCIKKTILNEGVRGLYKGLSPSILKAMISTAFTFTIYEEIKYIFVKWKL